MSKIISDKRFGRIIWPSIPAIIILFIVQTFASKCGSAIANLFDYKCIDQDDIFMRILVHHVIQMAIALLVIGALSGCEKEKDYRFAIIVASLLFSVAHISWTVFPVALSFSWFQLGYAFLLGLIYGITYIKSKSIIYPMFMHGLSNFIMVGVGYIFATIR